MTYPYLIMEHNKRKAIKVPSSVTTRNRFEYAPVPAHNLLCWLLGHSLVNQGQYPGEMQRTIKCVRCGWSIHDGTLARPYQMLDSADLDDPKLTAGTLALDPRTAELTVKSQVTQALRVLVLDVLNGALVAMTAALIRKVEQEFARPDVISDPAAGVA